MRLLRPFSATLFCVILAACGGGSSVTPSSTAPPSGTGASGLSSQSVQQSDVQAGVSGVQAARNLVGEGQESILITHRIAPVLRALLAHRAAAPTSCENGTSVTLSGNVITIDEYYDVACTQIESSLVWTETETATSFSGPATETVYSTNGSVTETAQLQVTVDLSSVNGNPDTTPIISGFSILTTSMRSGAGYQLGEAGLACALTSPVTCGVVAAVNGSSGESGINVNATAGSSASTSLSMQVQTYRANAANGLSISPATFPAWSIAPAGDLTQTISLTGQENSTQLSFTVNDATNGGALTITGATSGTVTGTLTSTSGGAQIASFTIDANGDGSVTFGNGTTATIAGYTIEG
jgi:hypothetical protein